MTNNNTSPVYEETFFIVPSYILKLEGLTFAYLKVYETIFQFWNKRKPCFLSNKAIQERTGVGQAQAREALLFFEKHNELERKFVNGRRFLVQPQNIIETDCPDTGGAGESAPPCRNAGTPPAGESAHNIKNNTNKENNNSLSKRARAREEDESYPQEESPQDVSKTKTTEKSTSSNTEHMNDWHNHTALYEQDRTPTVEHDLTQSSDVTTQNDLNALRKPLNRDDWPWFKQFWEIYPRQDNETKSLTQWIHDGCENIGDKILNDLQERIKRDKDFLDGCPLASTNYIRQKKWNTKIFEGKKQHFNYSDTSWINECDIFDQ